MYQSLHIHTPRCKHATGSELEYVLRAVEAGFTDMGFSDHAPLPEGFDPCVYLSRMEQDELTHYIADILALRERFRDKIYIRLGLELEYVPRMHKELVKRFRAAGIEYFVLGQHFLRDGAYTTIRPTDDDTLLTEYVDTLIEAASTGDFAFSAHPDFINYVGDAEFYRKEMERLCHAMRELDIPLEINMHGLADGRNYPNDVFWSIASRVGNRVLISGDVHCVDEMWDEPLYKRAKAFAAKHGITVSDKVL